MELPEERGFVRDLQRAVEEYSQSGDDLQSALEQASERVRTLREGGGPSLRWDVRSNVPEGHLAVRTREATPAVVTVDVPQDLGGDIDHVDFYQTSRSGEGTSETRLIGVAKYPDSDGRWRVEYSSSRVIPRENGRMILHAEVIGREGRVLAIDAVGIVD